LAEPWTALLIAHEEYWSEVLPLTVFLSSMATFWASSAPVTLLPVPDILMPPLATISPENSNPPTISRSPSTRSRPWPREPDDSDAHLLRLCLDLQLDALLLTLGAGAAQRVREDTEPGWFATGSLPWRRWLEEDLDLAEGLAADAMAGRATLPSTLGTEHDHRVPDVVLDNLLARYESMRDLLTDLLDRSDPDRDDGWRPRVREALHRCQTRLVELREFRLTSTPPTGLRIDLTALSGHGSPLAPEHEYLPGELLG